jgi:hypothetical protein
VVESSEDQNGDERKAPVIELWYGFYGILKRVRLVAILVAVALAGLFTGQGEDVLRSLVEGPDYLGLIVLYFGMLLWAVSAWYWSRVLLNYEFPDDPSLDKTAWAGFWRAVLPRLLGALGIVGLGLALAMIGGFNAWFCAGIAWALGGVYLFFVILRRRLFPAFFPAGTTIMVEDWPGLLAAYVDDLGRVARILLTLSLVVGLALFVLLTLFPVTIGAMFGTAGIFLLWASTMIPLAGLADLLTRRTRFPILLAVVAWGIVLSLWVDNHDLQRADEEVQPRQAARDHFAAWSERRLAGVEGEAVDRPIPVFFVASEGGGIRSAYWTAAILGYLQDHDDRFGRQLYAISGVSGGSMGAAVFAAELAAVTLPHPGAGAICPSLTPWSGFKSTGTEMLGRDYLAPIVGALLYPDPFQRIWPISISRLDRARAFEEAWRVNWLKACGLSLGNEPANPFARSFAFQNLWLEDRLYAVPQLLLNTTQVGTGRRAVTSSLAWSDDGEAPPYLDVLGLIEANDEGERRSLPLITAANLSARFPVVAPVGALRLARDGSGETMRFADGGYYENSGAASLIDLIERLRGEDPSRAAFENPRILPIILQISNDIDAVTKTGQPPAIKVGPTWMGELLSPLRTSLNTRSARGSEERTALRQLAETAGWPYLRFQLCPSPDKMPDPPLGWTLSDAAQSVIDAHLSDPEHCSGFEIDGGPIENAAHLGAIQQCLGGDCAAICSKVEAAGSPCRRVSTPDN